MADVGRARRLLIIRLLPFLGSAAVSLALFVPAHFALEPPNPDEQYGVLLPMLAAAGLLLLIKAAWALGRVVRASARLDLCARRHAAPTGEGRIVELPFLRGIALAGMVRPRVLIGTRARQALTPGELDVAVAHELAHQDAWDNLTRLMMIAAPCIFGFSRAARRIEQLWEAEAECLADARAVAGNPERATRLASALVKVARLASSGEPPRYSPGWSTFHHAALLETRIRLLVQRPPAAARAGRFLVAAAAVLGIGIVAAWLTEVPLALHRVTELLIARLP
jgi:beta-lactamase regulating signal transducer with metallopeptidase domain